MSLFNKTKQLQTFAESKEYHLKAITKTWLNNSVRNNELPLSKNCCVHRRDRELWVPLHEPRLISNPGQRTNRGYSCIVCT